MGLAKRESSHSGKAYALSREQLVNEYLPHVKRIVYRIAARIPSNIEIDDLMNSAVIGLLEAIDRYDPMRDNKFMTYAIYRIKGAVLSELRARDFLSRSNRRKNRELQQTYLSLEQKLGRKPNDDEVANKLDMDLDEFYKVKDLTNICFLSLDEIGFSSKLEREGVKDYLFNNISENAVTFTKLRETEEMIAKAINQLNKNEKLVVSMYYTDELTMKEIGKVLNVSESRVSQIHSQAIISLRRLLAKNGFFDT